MILSDGKNDFENNVFKFWKWSAPVLQTPDEVFAALHEVKLHGRVIQDVRAIGMGYNWREDDIWDSIYCSVEQQCGKAQAKKICDQETYPENIQMNRWAEIDEPMLIKFADGAVLGISFDEGSSVRLSMNTIPWDIRPGINPPTFHANRLFAGILGKPITSIEVTAALEEPVFTGSHGLHLEAQPAYLSKLALYCERVDITRPFCCLVFKPFYDYGNVYLVDYDGNCHKMGSENITY
ncbi:MAG: hypothetical protein AB7C98_12275, partial [Acidithiobacillus sp.]